MSSSTRSSWPSSTFQVPTPTSGSISTRGETSCSDCSLSPIFPWDFRDSYAVIEISPSWFHGEAKMSKLPRGEGVGRRSTQRTLTRAPHSRTQSRLVLLAAGGWARGVYTLSPGCACLYKLMARVRPKRTSLENPTGEIRDCEQSTSCYPLKGLHLLKFS